MHTVHQPSILNLPSEEEVIDMEDLNQVAGQVGRL